MDKTRFLTVGQGINKYRNEDKNELCSVGLVLEVSIWTHGDTNADTYVETEIDIYIHTFTSVVKQARMTP